MSNKDFINDFLSRQVRHDIDERTCVKNITTQEFEYWYDPQKVSGDGKTMMPRKCHLIPAGDIAQFPKGEAFDIGICLAKQIAYAKFGDKGLSVEKNWKDILENIVFPVGQEPKKEDPIAKAKEIIAEPAVVEVSDRDKYSAMPYNDLCAMLKEKGLFKVGMTKEAVITALIG